MKEPKKQLAAPYLRTSAPIAVGIGVVSLYIMDSITKSLPICIALVLHLPPFPPFLDQQSGPPSLYAWIGYRVSEIVVGRIAKTSAVLFAFITGVIYAGAFTFLSEYRLPASLSASGSYHLY